jgi:hypothetical protein
MIRALAIVIALPVTLPALARWSRDVEVADHRGHAQLTVVEIDLVRDVVERIGNGVEVP